MPCNRLLHEGVIGTIGCSDCSGRAALHTCHGFNHGVSLTRIQTLGSGYFGAAYLSGQSVIVQIIQYTILLPFGVAVAATIRVGNFLGKNAPDEARRAAISSLMLSFIAGMGGIPRLGFCRLIRPAFTLLIGKSGGG